MLSKPKPSALRRRARKYISLLLILATALVMWFELAVRAELTAVITASMKTAAVAAADKAVADYLSENPKAGESLSDLSFSDSGSVTAITTDPAAINRIKAGISRRARQNIDDLSRSEGLRVPLGSFTGLVVFSSCGPEVPLSVDSRSTVTCKLKSSFESAGINQTVHHISLIVESEISVYDPFRISGSITASSDYEISQTVISGPVPAYGGVVTY